MQCKWCRIYMIHFPVIFFHVFRWMTVPWRHQRFASGNVCLWDNVEWLAIVFSLFLHFQRSFSLTLMVTELLTWRKEGSSLFFATLVNVSPYTSAFKKNRDEEGSKGRNDIKRNLWNLKEILKDLLFIIIYYISVIKYHQKMII